MSKKDSPETTVVAERPAASQETRAEGEQGCGPAASVDLAKKRDLEAREVIRNYMFGNAAVGLIPLPLVDLVAFTGLQLKMIHSISNIYDVPFRQDLGKSILASLLGGMGTFAVAGGIWGSLMKFIPGVGILLTGVTLPAVSAAVTYAVGRVFIMHFEAGGTLLDFDAAKFRGYFEQCYQEGLKQAAEEKSAAKN